MFFKDTDMAKKKKQNRESSIENYYDLKVEEMDELVAALKGETPADSDEGLSFKISECTGADTATEAPQEKKTGKKKEKEFDPYTVDKLSKVPTWLKAIFIKFWFPGCVCYFIMMGLNLMGLDATVVIGLVLGLIVDILVNPCFRLMQSDRKEYDNYMMFPFPFKVYWTLIANMVYYVCVLICVNYCYYGLNLLFNNLWGTSGELYVAVEPLLMGILVLLFDMAFIGIKDAVVWLVRKRGKDKEEKQSV